MIFNVLFTFSVATSVLCATEDVRPLPVNNCKQNSTNYAACLKTLVEELWPEIVEGFPQIDLPCLDPVLYSNSILPFKIWEIHGELTLSNVIMTGLKNTNFLAVRTYIDDNRFRFEGEVIIPKLFVDGDCNAVGTLGNLGIRMGGKGHFNATVEIVRASAYMTGYVENNTLVAEHLQISPTIEKLKLRISDYFDGNKEINDLVELFMNEFWPPLYRRLIPTLMDAVDKYATNLCNRVFSKLSIFQIFQ